MFSRAQRWPSNIGIVVLNTFLLRILFPTAAVGVAEYASANQLGVLNLNDLGYAPMIFIGLYIIATLLLFPGSFLILACGALFEPWLGHTRSEVAGSSENITQSIVVAIALLAVVIYLPRMLKKLKRTNGTS